MEYIIPIWLIAIVIASIAVIGVIVLGIAVFLVIRYWKRKTKHRKVVYGTNLDS